MTLLRCILLFASLTCSTCSRVNIKTALESTDAGTETSEQASDGSSGILCNADALFAQLMEFNAETRGANRYEMYFSSPTDSKVRNVTLKNEFLEKMQEHLSQSAVTELQENAGNSKLVLRTRVNDRNGPLDSDKKPQRCTRLWIKGEAYSEISNGAQWVDDLRLGGGRLLQHGPLLQDYVNSAASRKSLDYIRRFSAPSARHQQDNGMFSKGIEMDGQRSYPGAVEFRDWMRNACRKIQESDNPWDMLEMGIEGSMIIVRNQVFSDANHRSAMALIGYSMPEEVSHTFFADVVDYAGSNGQFRSSLYAKMHDGWTVYNSLPSFKDAAWMGERYMAEYHQLLVRWLANNGGADWLAQHPEPVPIEPTRTACGTQNDCPGKQQCCDPKISAFTVGCKSFDQQGRSECFCAESENSC